MFNSLLKCCQNKYNYYHIFFYIYIGGKPDDITVLLATIAM